MNQPQDPYDRIAWEALVRIDPDIASAATCLNQFGVGCVDDLAASYLAIGEKRYLWVIVAKIQQEAEKRHVAASGAPNVLTENLTAPGNETLEGVEREHRRSERTVQDAPNADRWSAERLTPQFDSAKWIRLAAEDRDIAAAIASVAPYGSYYAADLAASYLAIDDKRYLSRVVSVILTEAQADRSSRANSSSLQFDRDNAKTPSFATNPGNGDWARSSAQWAESFAREYDSSPRSANQSKKPGSLEFIERSARPSNSGARRTVELFAVVAFLVASIGTLADVAYEYSTYRSAQGDAVRLRAYGHQCWICTFKADADDKANALETQARMTGERNRRNQAVALETTSFQNAQGNIASLEAYLRTCTVCAHADEARRQVARLEMEAAAQTFRDKQAAAVDTTSFQDAQGNIASLETYLRTCTICGHAEEARQQIARLEKEAADLEQSRLDASRKDEQAYTEARGNIDKLIGYLGGCFGCAFKSAAEEELRQLRQSAQPVEPPRQVTWRITNSTGLAIGVLFFSQTRPGQAWPGSNRNWQMIPGAVAAYSLACETGERICFGAFAPYRAESWGVGVYGNQACSNCCVLCDGRDYSNNLVLAGNNNENGD